MTRVIRGAAILLASSFAVAGAASGCTCGKPPAADGDASAPTASAAPDKASGQPTGLSAPIGAARLEGGDVVVAGLDVPTRAVRLQRITAKDEVSVDRVVLDDVKWSSESDLKVVTAGAGAAITWRGMRAGRLARQNVVVGADLAPLGAPVEVGASSCTTRDALWHTDGKRAYARPWSGAPFDVALPKDRDVALACGAHRSFAILDDESGASVLSLSKPGAHGADAGEARATSVTFLRDGDFGEDEQRERPEYTVDDVLGVVRLAASGALAFREVASDGVGPLRRARTTLPRDADIVAVDASARVLVIVFGEEAGEACPAGRGGGGASPSTKVSALRIDRTTFDESVLELSPGACGREVGPFYTGPLGDGVAVSWVERVPVVGQPRAPIAALAYRAVPAAGAPPPLGRIEQAADALADAGCDGTKCTAVVLARRPGADGMVPGFAKVLRYP